ncbi:Uncharacterized conserved protein YegJ, DUF2314 family [Octadecabacter temperatus]|uniref:Uncharacterized protein n=1 Tax=Octadecabacter temperatus TaxID=1458307 RepID=A0A0K0Y3X9_9RHOB|nr:DUF2314 domain-containing protein [Octadecabacter temperatus]AKS45635.1 hypothetical protein OSB_10790 [Octadecabacter temperatus]SIN97298.1 Uncharacterized conserved protein YegJ, DUF2314 family [Octadecabacter temperatus]
MRRVVIGAVILGGFWLYNNGHLDSILGSVAPEYVSTGSGDPVTEFSNDDSQMNAAEAEAQATFPKFLANAVDENGAAFDNVMLKAAFPTSGVDNAEVIWISGFQQTSADEFKGFLANQPSMMEGLNAGDEVTFTTDMVRDWSLATDDGQLFGNYTTRVMLPHVDEETAAMLGQMLSPDPVPADWN